MLMALLFVGENEIAAAAPACDQAPHGDRYWFEFHDANISQSEVFETAYVTIASLDLQSRLLRVGIDESVCGVNLAKEILNSIAPNYSAGRAA